MYATVTMAAMRFDSKRDWWLIAVLRGAPFVVFILVVSGWDVRHRGMAGPVAGLILLVAVQIFLFERLIRMTYYVIEGDTLVIHGGIANWRVPIASIRSVRPTRSALSSPALSLDRLRIEYGRRAVMVSPEEKQRFIDALRAVNPAITA